MHRLATYTLCGLIAGSLAPGARAEGRELELSPIDLARGVLPRPVGARSVAAFGCVWVAQSEPEKLVPTGNSAAACAELAARMNEGDELLATSDLGPVTLFVPRLGIRDSAHWPAFDFSGELPRLRYEGGALRALACRGEGGRWRAIDAVAGDPLQVTDTDAVRSLRAGARCAAERADGRVLHVLAPFNFSDWALSMAFLISGPLPLLALLASLLVAWLFHRSVRRSLSLGATSPPAEQAPLIEEPSAPLSPLVLGEPGASQLLRSVLARQRAQERVYLATGVGCAVLIALAYLADLGSLGSWRRLLVVSWAVAWPLIPTVAILRERPRVYLWLVPAYVLGLLLLGWFVAGLKETLMLALMQFIYGAAMCVLLLLRRARAFAPWMLSTFVAVVLVIQVPYLFLVRDDSRAAAEIMAALGMSARVGLIALFGMAALLALPLAFLALRALAYGYQWLGLNGRLLILVSFWFVYLATLALANGNVFGWLATALVLAVPLGARLLTRSGATRQAPRILYLRAFAARAQNLDLLTRVRVYLLNALRIELIAGPDLADSLAEPNELLNFVSGRGGRKYLHDLDQFEQQRAREGLSRDAEGRERVYEYYCSNSIWQEAFQRLARDAQLALMDLRGMDAASAGCRYELTQLIHHVPLAQFIVVINQGTDRALLSRIVAGAWSTMPHEASNASQDMSSLQVFEFDERRPGEALRLCAHVCGALERYGHIDLDSVRPGSYVPRVAVAD